MALPAPALAAEVRRAQEPDVDVLARDTALALAGGGALEEALRMGRMLSRFRTGLDLSGANGRESP